METTPTEAGAAHVAPQTYTCHRCPAAAVKRVACVDYCVRCYWAEIGPILRRQFLTGIDPFTGERYAPQLPDDAPIGVGRFVAPATSWPPGYALLACDTCSAEWTGPSIGELCSWCRHKATKQC